MSSDEIKHGLTNLTQLPPELEGMPRHRKEKKVGASVMGLGIMGIGVAVLAFTGFLALRAPMPSVWVILGSAVFAILFLVWGALTADPETVWPVLRGIVGLMFSVNRARKS